MCLGKTISQIENKVSDNPYKECQRKSIYNEVKKYPLKNG